MLALDILTITALLLGAIGCLTIAYRFWEQGHPRIILRDAFTEYKGSRHSAWMRIGRKEDEKQSGEAVERLDGLPGGTERNVGVRQDSSVCSWRAGSTPR